LSSWMLLVHFSTRAIWGEVNTRAIPSTQSIASPSGVPRAKFWAGSVIVLVIAVGVVVFGVQGQRFAAQDQQRRDCLQLKITRLQENRIPLPPPPPPLLPGTKVSPELEATMKRLEAQRQKLTDHPQIMVAGSERRRSTPFGEDDFHGPGRCRGAGTESN